MGCKGQAGGSAELAERAGFLIVVAGLLAEARLASASGVRAIAGGGDRVRLAREIERAIGDGGSALMSFGIAAGLAANLPPGTLVVATQVAAGGERYACDPAWVSRLRRVLPHSIEGVLAGVDAPLSTPAAKRALELATGAKAADMESHVAARAASRHGLRFAALRAIADPAERALPAAVLAGLGSEGRADWAAVARALVLRPTELAAVLRVAADARHALQALARATRALGRGLRV
jgi:hopanoid-associated phosphorylase